MTSSLPHLSFSACVTRKPGVIPHSSLFLSLFSGNNPKFSLGNVNLGFLA